MPLRLLALVLLFAVLPTVELIEQAVHVVEHAIDGDAPTHSAHHDDSHGDEHGCTGLVHLCGCHHTQITASTVATTSRAVETLASLAPSAPGTLRGLTSIAPPHRPPIA